MSTFESNVETVNKSIGEVYRYLSDPENYRALMPDKVRSFTTLEKGAKLEIQGLGEVELVFSEMKEPERIEMQPKNKMPFPFDLQWHLKETGPKQTRIQALIHAELNFMMRMMAESFLKEFLNVQVSKLKEKLNHD